MENKRESTLKKWLRICEPNKKIWIWQTIFYSGYTIFLAIFTLFAAKTINCIYTSNWTMAFIYLGIEFLLIMARNICLHIEVKFHTKHVSKIQLNIADKIYKKLMSTKKSEIKRLTKETIMNTATNNSVSSSEFPDAISISIGTIIQICFILVTVFVLNYIAGIVILCLGVLNFFVYCAFNRKLGRIANERKNEYENMNRVYSKVLDGESVINEFEAKKLYKEEVFDKVAQYSKSYSKYFMVNSCKMNLFFIAWNFIVYSVAALMLFLVSTSSLEISLYLVIVPYLTSCTTQLNLLFDKTNNYENMKVEINRFDLILNMNDKELIKYGDIIKDGEFFNLSFLNVSCFKIAEDKEQKIVDADISFKTRGVTTIKGNRSSGKRIIFNILRRSYKPDRGMVLLDGCDLFDYETKTYNNNIFYCSSHPFFIEGSIRENLELADKDFNKIKNACAMVGLTPYIKSLKNGFDTEVDDLSSDKNLFLIGLARAILSKCKILMIYEIPQGMNLEFVKDLKKIIKKLANERSIIIFAHDNSFSDIADVKYEVKEGEILINSNIRKKRSSVIESQEELSISEKIKQTKDRLKSKRQEKETSTDVKIKSKTKATNK